MLCKVVRSLVVFLIISSPLISFAEQIHEAIPGEYVVELNPQPSSLTTGESNLESKISKYSNVEKTLGDNKTLLIKSKINFASVGDSTTDKDSFCDSLYKNGIAKSCSPNYILKAYSAPNDPSYSQMWNLGAAPGIEASPAWDVTSGSSSTVVAVIDTGVDYNHPDLSTNIWTNPNEIPGNGIDDDGNGYIDDVHGINAITGSGNPMDDNGHGTHVSGTIGGRTNNGLGIAGVNWNVRIIGLKFLDASGSGSLADAIEAINYMVWLKNHGVNIKVVNNSWGGGGYSQPLFDAIKRVRDAGIVFAAAAGNESNDNDENPAYPASYNLENVVSVASITSDGNLSSFSNYGYDNVDIAAPGSNILSTIPGGGYARYNGTSMATPHVTGAVALLASSEPNLSYSELIQRVYLSGTDLPTLSGVIATGRTLNINKLVRNITVPVSAPTVDACSYLTTEIPFAPDTSADKSSIILQADDRDFKQVNLPFDLPFYSSSVSKMKISPNGVLYFNGQTIDTDYRNGSKAPKGSLAALQTDLVAVTDPYGVRIKHYSNRTVVSYRAKHYRSLDSGEVRIWITLYSNGIIDEFIQFSNGTVASAVQSGAVIGISGLGTNSYSTYAVNSSSIRSGLGIRFSRGDGCPTVNTPQVTKVKVNSTNNSARLRTHSSTKVNLSLIGNGVGRVSLYPGFNNKFCNQSVRLSFANGASATASVPVVPSSYRTIRFKAGTAVARYQLYSKSRRTSQVRIRSAEDRRFDRACSSVVRSVRQR